MCQLLLVVFGEISIGGVADGPVPAAGAGEGSGVGIALLDPMNATSETA